mgnify:FL=1
MLIAGKKTIALILGIIICGSIAGICAGAFAKTVASPDMPTIVIDAGHGGIDAGVYGVNTDVKESDINLAIARELRGWFVNAGFNCVMTRNNQSGLYGDTSKGFKKRDMQERKRIIEENSADMVISIHQNTCPLPSRRGGYVFFDGNSQEGRELALSVQEELNALWEMTNEALVGDYFMLKCTEAPSILVECGFLSNGEDEKLLTDADYRNKIAYAIFKGAIMYLS